MVYPKITKIAAINQFSFVFACKRFPGLFKLSTACIEINGYFSLALRQAEKNEVTNASSVYPRLYPAPKTGVLSTGCICYGSLYVRR